MSIFIIFSFLHVQLFLVLFVEDSTFFLKLPLLLHQRSVDYICVDLFMSAPLILSMLILFLLNFIYLFVFRPIITLS